MNSGYKIPRPYLELGEFLRAAREGAGFTQREVSVYLGHISSQSISNAERGISALPASKMRVVLNLYKIPAEAVVEKIMKGQQKILADELLVKKR